jgi:competence protein ComEC
VSFILYKKGFGKFKAVPIFVLGVLILQSYYFFPRIDYVNLGGRDGVIICYKSERVLIHNQSKEISNKESGKFTKVVSNPIDDLLLRLGKNYSIRIPAVREYDKDSINIEISAYESKTILTRNTEDYMDIDLNKYDIIKLPKQGFYPFNGKFTDKIPRRSYAVIFAKVYTLHGD